MSDRVVGDEDCDTRDVVDTLFESKSLTGLMENWKTIARDLGLHPTKVSTLDTQKKNGESIEEIWYLVLDAWVSAKRKEAKLSVLDKILRKPKYTTADAADKVQEKFLGSAAAPAGASTLQAAAAPPGASTQQAAAASVPPVLNLEEIKKQIAHIDKNLPLLTEWTQVNTSLTSFLVSTGLLSTVDVYTLDAISAKNMKAMAFYDMIKGKGNFYPHLIAALEAGSQTGAVGILKSI